MSKKDSKIDENILANWLLCKAGRVSHLRLQKLLFYCYGGLVATGFERAVDGIYFEAWKYGPVCRSIWDRFKSYDNRPIEEKVKTPKLAPEAEGVLSDILAIYGKLTPGQLVMETHFEKPWIDAYREGAGGLEIPKAELDKHFRNKFGREVYPPRVLSGIGSFEIDGIPVQPHRSLHILAKRYAR